MTSVIIVGGGIAGTAVAYQLKDSEHDVTLLEKDALGAGTTGKSIACFAWHLNHEGTDYEIASRAWDIYEPLIENGTLSYHENGFMKVAESQAFFEELLEGVEELRAAGVPAEILDSAEIEAHNVNPEIASAGATFYPSIGRLDPGEIISHFADRARASSVDIRTGTEVTDVITEGEAVVGVETVDGSIRADIVVNAAGPWSPILNRMAGVSLPLKHTLAPISVLDSTENFELPTVILENGVYFTGEKSAKILAGRAPHESSDEDVDLWEAALELEDPNKTQGMGIGSVEEEHRNIVAETAPQAIPKAKGAEVSSEWRGIRCISPDHHPFVGPTDVEGFYTITGMCGEGITLAPACAELLADHLRTGELSSQLEYLSPQRTVEGH